MFIFWIVLIIVITVSYYFYTKDKKVIRHIFRDIANETDASIRDSFFYYPQLRIDYHSSTIAVSAMASGGQGDRPPQTFASFPTKGLSEENTFILQSRSVETSIDKALGYRDMNIGNSKIDNNFIIYAKDSLYTQKLFTKEIQDSIIKLNSEHGIKISIQNSDYFDGDKWAKGLCFDIKILKVSTDYEDYIDIMNIAKLFCDEIKR